MNEGDWGRGSRRDTCSHNQPRPGGRQCVALRQGQGPNRKGKTSVTKMPLTNEMTYNGVRNEMKEIGKACMATECRRQGETGSLKNRSYALSPDMRSAQQEDTEGWPKDDRFLCLSRVAEKNAEQNEGRKNRLLFARRAAFTKSRRTVPAKRVVLCCWTGDGKSRRAR